MALVECSGLSKSYSDIIAVDSLDLQVQQGDVLGLLGPNGAGKTTTIRMLLGLIHPSEGSVQVLDKAAGDFRALAEIGSMVEEPAFYPWLTGRRNLKVVLDSGAPFSTGAVDEALRRVDASGFADRRVGTYSQGMRQRLGLAATLLRRPRLLVLDEPTNGLDPEGIHFFRDLVRQLSSEGTTLIISSHQLSEVEQMCERVAVIDRGRLLADTRIDEIDRGRYLRVEVTEEELEAAMRALSGFKASISEASIVVEAERGREVSAALGAAGVFPEELRAEKASLEDWYLSLTGKGEDALPSTPAG